MRSLDLGEDFEVPAFLHKDAPISMCASPHASVVGVEMTRV